MTTASTVERCEALLRCVRAVRPHVVDPADRAAVTAAAAVAERGVARLRIAGEHTVVALAGATGGGKSSLFNALARMDLSGTGHLRPTTAEAHACSWGTDDNHPGELLDWLGVARRFRRESQLDADDEAPLRGLVLLDLPDLDSVATRHRIDAERLLGVVDLVIWVLDPQKYADQTVHDGYLRHLGAVRETTVVVFNQIDRLRPVDVARCRADVARLVEADGLLGVPVVMASALTGEGVDDLRALLEKVVADRRAVLTRLDGELDEAASALAPIVGSAPAKVGQEAEDDLAAELTTAAGVPTVAAQDAAAYARRAAIPGWPFRRRSADPGDAPAAPPHAVSAALRRLARRASVGLPSPWPDEAEAAVARIGARVPGALGEVVRAARPRPPRTVGWAVARALWWLGVAMVVGGVGLIIGYGADAGAILIAVGALTAVVVPAVARPLAAARVSRRRAVVERRLREAVAALAGDAAAPVRAVVRDHADARAALAAVGAPHDEG